ncbi:MAG: S1C family serine protease [Gaiellaceae bacterium]
MLSLRTASTYAALAVTAALGGALAVGAVALLGGFDDDPTVVTETAAAPRTESRPQAGGALSINEIYRRAAPGVVQITSISDPSPTVDPRQIDPFADPLPQAPSAPALGSGFVIDKAGHIVTNYHVVQGGADIRVSFSNRDTVAAEVVGVDPSTDLAVLEVDASSDALTPLALGDSDDVAVGDQVVAIGNPFGLDRTATAGIVSALQRLITAPNSFAIDHVIQTDAPINKGNSGGPLLNDRAEVIGVNAQIETGNISTGNVGIGFAVPSNTVKDVVAQILRTGRVEHAWLGIIGQPVTEELAAAFNLPVEEGVLVESVLPGSGAAAAKLEPGETEVVVAGETYVLGGDIIVSINGEKISAVEEIRDVIAAHKPGQKMKLGIFRDQEKSTVTVTLGRQPSSAQG